MIQTAGLLSGQTHKIPFLLSETDITCDVILLADSPSVCDFWVETPEGEKIDTATASALASVTYVLGDHVAYYRISLPVPLPSTSAHNGTWHAVLEINDDRLVKYIGQHDDNQQPISDLQTHGMHYSINVHSYSNLRMRPTLTQSSYEPGAQLMLNVVMTEYGMPMDNRAEINAEVTAPNAAVSTLPLLENAPGVFDGNMLATQSGVYTFRIMAEGRTLRGREFTREQTLTGVTWKGGDNPAPTGTTGKDPDGGDVFRRCCTWMLRLAGAGVLLLLIIAILLARS